MSSWTNVVTAVIEINKSRLMKPIEDCRFVDVLFTFSAVSKLYDPLLLVLQLIEIKIVV